MLDVTFSNCHLHVCTPDIHKRKSHVVKSEKKKHIHFKRRDAIGKVDEMARWCIFGLDSHVHWCRCCFSASRVTALLLRKRRSGPTGGGVERRAGRLTQDKGRHSVQCTSNSFHTAGSPPTLSPPSISHFMAQVNRRRAERRNTKAESHPRHTCCTSLFLRTLCSSSQQQTTVVLSALFTDRERGIEKVAQRRVCVSTCVPASLCFAFLLLLEYVLV